MAPDRIITVGSTGGKLQAVSLRECASNAGCLAIVANGLAAKLAGPLLSPFRLARLPAMDWVVAQVGVAAQVRVHRGEGVPVCSP